MDAALAARIEAAAEQAPMSNGEAGAMVPGRLLLADGDGLCYYCAGNDETEPGQARQNLIDKLRAARAACGAEAVKIVTTARASNKGFRYAIARVKPYQGHRGDSRRPKNWEFLRELLETGDVAEGMEVEFTSMAEADDLFSRYAKGHPDCVIYTQDKDMRMVPGWHLDWLTHILFKLDVDTWEKVYNEKVWGRKWFWLQVLQGDTADNIPGLPFYVVGDKEKRIGEKTALDMLSKCKSDMQALIVARDLYASYYKDRWLVELLEQAILVWMRNDQTSNPFNVTAYGNPLYPLLNHAHFPAAKAEIMKRIAESLLHEETEDNGSCNDSGSAGGGAERQVCDLPASDAGIEAGSGSRSLDGPRESDPAQRVQQPAGQDREQLPQVRGSQPTRVPSWSARLLAKA
jgi:DNA polymerase-1